MLSKISVIFCVFDCSYFDLHRLLCKQGFRRNVVYLTDIPPLGLTVFATHHDLASCLDGVRRNLGLEPRYLIQTQRPGRVSGRPSSHALFVAKLNSRHDQIVYAIIEFIAEHHNVIGFGCLWYGFILQLH